MTTVDHPACVPNLWLTSALSDADLIRFCRTTERELKRTGLGATASPYNVASIAVPAYVYALEVANAVAGDPIPTFDAEYVRAFLWQRIDDTAVTFLGMSGYLTSDRREHLENVTERASIRARGRSLAHVLSRPDVTSILANRQRRHA